MTPFTQVLMQARKGQAHDVITEDLAKVVEAVRLTGKPGELSIKLKVAPEKGGEALEFTFDTAVKLPKPSLPKALFYTNDENDLFRTDPNQREMAFEDVSDRRSANN